MSTTAAGTVPDVTPRRERPDARVAAPAGGLRGVLESSPFPILLVSLVGILLLTAFGPALVVGDTWLMLMAGREVVDHGLPETETLTVLGSGATWTDQQWLAHLVVYGADALAGIRAVVVLDVLVVVAGLALALGAARAAGATSRSTFLVGLLAVLAGPWGWTMRAQATALPLFAGVLWLLLDAARHGVRRRTLLVLPALVVWANLHGSVLLGAALTTVLGVYELVRVRRLDWLPLALAVLAPLCVLATPYGWDVVAYYELMLVDAPFAEILREWQWSSPERDDGPVLRPRVGHGRPRRDRPLPPPAHRLRAARPGGHARGRRPGRARRDLVRARRRRDPPRGARRPPHAARPGRADA